MYKLTAVALLVLTLSSVASAQTRVPFKVHNGAILIETSVNGKPATLLIDSGAKRSTFSLKYAGVADDSVTLVSSAGTQRAPIGNASCKFAGINFNVEAAFVPAPPVADGLVGFDILSAFRSVAIDFEHKELILTK